MSLGREGGRWFVKSLLGFCAGVTLLAVWVEWVGIRPELAIVANHILISFGTYTLTDRWVFADYSSPTGLVGHARQYLSFQAVMLVSNGTKYVLFVALLWVGVWYLAAWTVAAGLLFTVSFAGNRWLWASNRSMA